MLQKETIFLNEMTELNDGEPHGRWLIDPKIDLQRIYPVWRKIAKHAEIKGNNTKTAKLFWRALTIGKGRGHRSVSAAAKKVRELRKARIANYRPFDVRIKGWKEWTDDPSSDYEDGGLPDDDFDQCCVLSRNYRSQTNDVDIIKMCDRYVPDNSSTSSPPRKVARIIPPEYDNVHQRSSDEDGEDSELDVVNSESLHVHETDGLTYAVESLLYFTSKKLSSINTVLV